MRCARSLCIACIACSARALHDLHDLDARHGAMAWRKADRDAAPLTARPTLPILSRSLRSRPERRIREQLAIFSPPILTALQAGACAHLSTALCKFHPQAMWKTCAARQAAQGLRATAACVGRCGMAAASRGAGHGVRPGHAEQALHSRAYARAIATHGTAAPRRRCALLQHQSRITCGTKREVSRVIGPSSSRMPSPAGRSATTQLPTSACRPSNTGNG